MERFELKYLVEVPVAGEIERLVRRRGTRDAYDRSPEGYLVSSTYFDTPDLLCYYEKKDGVAIRRKYRFRTYGPEPEYGFFEIKYRRNQLVDKQRVRFEGSQWPGLLNDSHQFCPADPLQAMAVNVLRVRELRPTHLVQYVRRAYLVDGADLLRITFDFDVCGCNVTDHRLDNLTPHQVFAGYCVLELKTRRNLPGWCLEILNRYGLLARPISKYVLTLEKLREH